METAVCGFSFCLRCGYDLTGLDLPRPCPECGQLAEASYEERARPAREWFNSRRAWLWWLHRTSKLPPGLFYVLNDAESHRTARRRLVLSICLPVVLTSLTVLLGSGISVNYAVRVWYYDRNDPQHRLLREVHGNEANRFFVETSGRFRDSTFLQRPTNWVQVVERTPVGLDVSAPDGDPMTAMMIVWSYCVFTIAAGISEAGLLPAWIAIVARAMAVGAWTAGCLWGWPRLVCLDTLRLVFRRPAIQAIFLGGTAAAPLLYIALPALR